MTLQILIQQIKQEYGLKSIANTRYSALDKVVNLLMLLEENDNNRSSIQILNEMGKEQFKQLYSEYKATQLQLSSTLSGAENQAINDLYKALDTPIPSIPLPPESAGQSLTAAHKKTGSSNEDRNEHLKNGLPPMVGEAPKILILGTMPSDISIQELAYYRNESRNIFWKIMHSIFPDDATLSHEELLEKHHIALWDCLKSGIRKGSTDNGLMGNYVPNDLYKFLKTYPTIKVIVLNGKGKSSKGTYSLFNRFFSDLNNRYKVIALHSTSNLNTTVSAEEKLKEWSVIKDFL